MKAEYINEVRKKAIVMKYMKNKHHGVYAPKMAVYVPLYLAGSYQPY